MIVVNHRVEDVVIDVGEDREKEHPDLGEN